MDRIKQDDIVEIVGGNPLDTRVDIRMSPPDFKKICLSLGYTFKSGANGAYGYQPNITMASYRLKDGFASFWSR